MYAREMASSKHFALSEDELNSCIEEDVRCFLYLEHIRPAVRDEISKLSANVAAETSAKVSAAAASDDGCCSDYSDCEESEEFMFNVRLSDISTGENLLVPFEHLDKILATIEPREVSKNARPVSKALRRLRSGKDDCDAAMTDGSALDFIRYARKTGYDLRVVFAQDLAESILALDDGSTFMKLFSVRDPDSGEGFANETLGSVIPMIDHEHVNILRSMLDRSYWSRRRDDGIYKEYERFPSYVWDSLLVRAILDERASQMLNFYFKNGRPLPCPRDTRYTVELFGFELTLKSLAKFLFASPNHSARILNRGETVEWCDDDDYDGDGVSETISRECNIPVDLGKFCKRDPVAVLEFEDDEGIYTYDEKTFCEMFVELFGHCDGFSGVPDGEGGLVERTLKPWSALKIKLDSLEKLQADHDVKTCCCGLPLPKKIRKMYPEEDEDRYLTGSDREEVVKCDELLPGMSGSWSRPDKRKVLGYYGGLGLLDVMNLDSEKREIWGSSSLLLGFFAGLESALERGKLPPKRHVSEWFEKMYAKQGREVLYCLGDLMRSRKQDVKVFDLLNALNFL